MMIVKKQLRYAKCSNWDELAEMIKSLASKRQAGSRDVLYRIEHVRSAKHHMQPSASYVAVSHVGFYCIA